MTDILLRINAEHYQLLRNRDVRVLMSKCERMPDSGAIDPDATVTAISDVLERTRDFTTYLAIMTHLTSILYSMSNISLLWWMSNHTTVEALAWVALCFERAYFLLDQPDNHHNNIHSPQQLSACIVTLLDYIAVARRTDAFAPLKLQHEEMFKANPALQVFLRGPAATAQ